MGWVIVLSFVAIALGLVLRFGQLPRQAVELSVAALLLGVAGYVWQGSPGLGGSPVPSRAAAAPEVAITDVPRAVGDGSEAAWIEYAESLGKRGLTENAVTAIRQGIVAHPASTSLWIALGNALVVHSDGLMTPAAQFAFQHAAGLSPDNPGPAFFFGLALAQAGKTDEGAAVWRALLARSPKNAPWRADLEARIAEISAQANSPERATAPAKP